MDDSFIEAYKKARSQNAPPTSAASQQQPQIPMVTPPTAPQTPITNQPSESTEQIVTSSKPPAPDNTIVREQEVKDISSLSTDGPLIANTLVMSELPVSTSTVPQSVETPRPIVEKKQPRQNISFLKEVRIKDIPDKSQADEIAKPQKPPVTHILQSKLFLFLTVLVGLSIVAALGFIVYKRYQPTTVALKARPADNPQVLGKDQELADSYIEEIAKIMALPKDEKPVGVATISDETKVKQNERFFKNAKNGDVLVIYSNRAILYDPKNKVIVDVIPVNLENQQQNTATVSADPQQ